VSTNLFEPSGGDALPGIPVWLSHRPVLAGLAVPWVTARGADGRFLFGALDRQRQQQAIGQHRCQVCGRPLGTRTILLMRLSDLPRKATSEPGLDPVCAAYSAAACPVG
jgi:ribosomal protein S14